jgi:hypothetical protein
MPNIGYVATGQTNQTGTGIGNLFFDFAGFTGVDGATIQSMSGLLSNSDASNHNIQFAIYTLSAGTYSLQASTGSINVAANASKVWLSGNLTTPLVINSATVYYLMACYDNGSVSLWTDTVAGKTFEYKTMTYGSWPATFTSPSTYAANNEVGIYATYTIGGGTIPLGVCRLWPSR